MASSSLFFIIFLKKNNNFSNPVTIKPKTKNRLRKVKMDQRKLMDNANTITDMAKVSYTHVHHLHYALKMKADSEAWAVLAFP